MSSVIASDFNLIKIVVLILILIGFAIVHLIKLMRLYLMVMDQNISFARFVPAYLRTTLVNLIIPYKLGEIYRIGVFARITKSFRVGFFCVLADRFFDTLALVAILIPCKLLMAGHVTAAEVFLAVFLIVVILAYVLLPSSYKYLNRYIITRKTSRRSLRALKGLEAVHEWYLYVQELISGRYGLLMVSSLGAWIAEIAVLFGVAFLLDMHFDALGFANYISSILSGSTDRLNVIYTIWGAAIIAAATLVFTAIYLLGRDRGRTGGK